MKIKVLGPGCPRCFAVEEITKRALAELNVSAEIEHISDFREFIKYDIMFTPGLVINEKLKASGRIPSLEEIKGWIKEEL